MKAVLSVLMLSLLACGSNGSLVNSSNDDLPTDLSLTASFTINSVHHRSPDVHGEVSSEGFHVGDQLIFTKGEGEEAVTIELEVAAMSWKSFTLISDGEDESCVTGVEVKIPLQVSEDFLAMDLIPLQLGQATIPSISYCQYKIEIAPLEDSASEEDIDIIDSSLSYQFIGRWIKGDQTGEFEVSSTEPVVIQLHFKAMEDGKTIDHPLHFVEGETSSTILLGNKYDYFFNGIEALDFTADDLHHQISHLIQHSFHHTTHQHLGAHHGSDNSDGSMHDDHSMPHDHSGHSR